MGRGGRRGLLGVWDEMGECWGRVAYVIPSWAGVRATFEDHALQGCGPEMQEGEESLLVKRIDDDHCF